LEAEVKRLLARIEELEGDIDELVDETGSLMLDRIKHLDRIEELEAENKRLFDAHSVEMLRADKLQQTEDG
jgi:hypothetical protein